MLSRLALRGGSLTPILRTELRSGLNLTAVRTSSQLETWKRAHELFNSPERDHKNFPAWQMEENPPPVRMGLLPESWFKFFYEKTGVSGPYLLGTTFTMTLISKELWVVEHVFVELMAFVIAVGGLLYRYAPKINKYLANHTDQVLERTWKKPLEKAKTDCAEAIESYEQAIWSEQGQAHIFEAKRENVALQLEEEYRKRLFQSYEAVKKRLDYHVAVENSKRRFQQDYMVNWIVDSVVKGITPQQERDSIAKCIGDLKVLAKAN